MTFFKPRSRVLRKGSAECEKRLKQQLENKHAQIVIEQTQDKIDGFGQYFTYISLKEELNRFETFDKHPHLASTKHIKA